MPDHSIKHQLLAHFALRAQKDPFFVGYYLTAYGEQNALSLPQVAAYLGFPPEGLTKLMLCRAPDPATERFHDDVIRVAKFADCDADRLGKILREVTVINTMRGLISVHGDASTVTLLAARDNQTKGGRRRSQRGDNLP